MKSTTFPGINLTIRKTTIDVATSVGMAINRRRTM
jgi:hypothetical protein